MKIKIFQFSYQEHHDASSLHEHDRVLLQKAQEAVNMAYAPYSAFRVGAAARLDNHEIVTAANQENASYPVGICAERVLLSTISATHPHTAIVALAVSYFNEKGSSDAPISPCGICRQSLIEYQNRFGKKMRLVMGGQSGKVFVIEEAGMLLPFCFSAADLK